MGAFTKQELIAASRKAEAEGDHGRAKRLAQMSLDAGSPTDVLGNPDTFMGRVFRAMDDPTAVAMDAFTRGFGHTEQAATDVRAARERLPAAEELPADIAGSVMGSPYKVTGMIGGGVAGGLEGVVNAYGHQKNWVPSRDDLVDLAIEGGKGAVLGSGLAKAGEKIGNWWAGKKAPAPEFPTDQALETGTYKAMETGASNVDELLARTQRLEAARAAQGAGDVNEFTKLQPANPAELDALQNITRSAGGNLADKAVSAGQVLSGKKGNLMTRSGATLLGAKTGGLSSGIGLATEGLGTLFGKGGGIKGVDPKLMEAYATAIRNGGDPKDPGIIDMARTMLAQAGVGAGKSPVLGGPR